MKISYYNRQIHNTLIITNSEPIIAMITFTEHQSCESDHLNDMLCIIEGLQGVLDATILSKLFFNADSLKKPSELILKFCISVVTHHFLKRDRFLIGALRGRVTAFCIQKGPLVGRISGFLRNPYCRHSIPTILGFNTRLLIA